MSRAGVIREFFSSSFNGYSLADDEDLFGLGFVNSLFALELVEFVEREFDIVIEEEDLEFENFSTISGMLGLVDRKAECDVPERATG